MAKGKQKFFSLGSVMVLLYIMVVAFIPLAVRLRKINFQAPIETWPWFPSGVVYDFFAQFRLEVLLGLTSCIVLVALLKYYYDHDQGAIKKSYLDYPTGIFALFLAVSALASPFIDMAFWGFYERGEGAAAYFCYLLLFMVAANFIHDDRDKKVIFFAMLAAGVLQALVAAGQYLGYDFLQTGFAKRILFPAEYLPLLEEGAELRARTIAKAYGFTYNPNYLGGYMAMLFPMALVLFLYSRSLMQAAAAFAVVAILGVGVVAASSTGSFLALGLAFLFFFILTVKDLRLYYKKLVALLLIAVCLGIGANSAVTEIVQRQVNKIVSNYAQLVGAGENEAAAYDLTEQFPEVREKESLSIEIKRYPLDSFASGRGYIWRKSVETVFRNNLFLGSGLDTLLYNFPLWAADRDVSRFHVGWLVDKPHNTYLQVGLGVGLLGLLVYLYMLGLHFINYVRVYRRRGVKNNIDAIMLAVFTGWLAYLFQGLSNDSVLSNAPVFWVVFGLSVNYVQNLSRQNGSFLDLGSNDNLKIGKKRKEKNITKKKK
ncbi:MAG TPA: hypothetical protein GX735_00670 [Firmicutes bacterium]|nr:hypothetical protein [Bacillota bacterium]